LDKRNQALIHLKNGDFFRETSGTQSKAEKVVVAQDEYFLTFQVAPLIHESQPGKNVLMGHKTLVKVKVGQGPPINQLCILRKGFPKSVGVVSSTTTGTGYTLVRFQGGILRSTFFRKGKFPIYHANQFFLEKPLEPLCKTLDVLILLIK
jgi:hypothetical protein